MGYIGVDQYGHTYRIKKHPRKELSAFLPGKVNKMYVGEGTHVGYVIGPLWITVYKLSEWK